MEKIIRKLFTVSLLIFVFSCNNSKTKVSQTPEEIKAAVEKVLKLQEENYGNNTPEGFKALAATCEDSMLYVGGEDGGTLTSSYAYSRDMADGYKVKPHQRIFRIFENAVVVSSIQQSYKLYDTDTFFMNVRSNKVFVREGYEWKLGFVTNTPLPIRYITPHITEPNKFSDYVGWYKGGGSVDTVTYIDGKFYISPTGGGKMEWTPISDSSFIGEGFFGKAVFARDLNGKVAKYYFEWADGQRISFRKIK